MADGFRFRDTAGRDWTFVCNVFTLARCKKETGVDLAKSIESGADILKDVADDVAVFFDVISSLLQDEMKARGVGARELGEGINDEDVVIEATQALVRAVIDFFPKSRSKTLRTAFDRLWNVTREKADLEASRAIEKIEAMNIEEMAEEIMAEVKSTRSRSVASSEGTEL